MVRGVSVQEAGSNDVIRVAILAAAILVHAPEGANPELAPWYHSLHAPDGVLLCCDVADCRPVATRERNGHIEAWIGRDVFPGGIDQWVEVPERAILVGHDNPVGEPVACWYLQEIRCFVPGVKV